MGAPLGFFVIGLLFCNNPDTNYKYRDWFQDRETADRMANILNDGKWFYDKGRKCIYKSAKVVPER